MILRAEVLCWFHCHSGMKLLSKCPGIHPALPSHCFLLRFLGFSRRSSCVINFPHRKNLSVNALVLGSASDARDSAGWNCFSMLQAWVVTYKPCICLSSRPILLQNENRVHIASHLHSERMANTFACECVLKSARSLLAARAP